MVSANDCPCSVLGVKKDPPRVCNNQPVVLENFGVCGGVQQGGDPASRAAINRRSTRRGKGGISSQQGCPPCQVGASVVNSQGGYNCDTGVLTVSEQKSTFGNMFGKAERPIYIRRPNTWFIYRR